MMTAQAFYLENTYSTREQYFCAFAIACFNVASNLSQIISVSLPSRFCTSKMAVVFRLYTKQKLYNRQSVPERKNNLRYGEPSLISLLGSDRYLICWLSSLRRATRLLTSLQASAGSGAFSVSSPSIFGPVQGTCRATIAEKKIQCYGLFRAYVLVSL